MKDLSRCLCICYQIGLLSARPSVNVVRHSSTVASKAQLKDQNSTIEVNGREYKTDDLTNLTPKIKSHLGINLLNQKYHPLSFLKQRIVDYFYKKFIGRTGTPIFSVHDNLDPVVTVQQNFDSLLVPADHVSRSKSDCYYINSDYLLRSHMTAHQADLVHMGLDSFLMFGDVYRRDEIDSTHYPVFHQVDGVRLFHQQQVSETNSIMNIFLGQSHVIHVRLTQMNLNK